MEQRTRELYERFGIEDVRDLFLYFDSGDHPNYPDGKSDGTHLSEFGAREVCLVAVEGMRVLKPTLSAFVSAPARPCAKPEKSSASRSFAHKPCLE